MFVQPKNIPFCPFIYEEWRKIDFFNIEENMYLISNFGRVYSNITERIMGIAYSNGYPTIQLRTKNGNRTTFYVHRLVAKAFIPNNNPDELIEVDHLNMCRDNPMVTNLEWVSKEENNKRKNENKGKGGSIIKGKSYWGDGEKSFGENNGMAKLKEVEVRTMLSCLEIGMSYKDAIIEAGLIPTKQLISNLSHIARGHRWKFLKGQYNIPNDIPKSYID